MSGKRFKILCIDGGGIKGVFSASVLAMYEEMYGIRMTDYFDLIAGTSTGGIIALGASLGIPMADIVKFYESYGPIIFDQRNPPKTCIGKCFRSMKFAIKQAIWRSKYDNIELEKALRHVFRDHTLKDSNNLLCIPAYNITAARNRVFKKDYGCKYNTDNNLSYVDVAIATAAAPTYFPVKEIDNVQYIDGGLWALNPTLTALTEFLRNFYSQENPYDYDSVSILSISSCQTNIQDYAPKKNRSFFEWKNTLFDIYTDGQNQSVNFFVQQIQKHLPFIDIVRVQNDSLSPQTTKYIDMDNASLDSIKLMKGLGRDTAIKYKKDVVKFFKTTKTFNF